MNKIFLYNSLNRKKEEFQSINPGRVGIYTCGPTVYNFAHIGNLRTYLFEDFLIRVLKYNDYQVKRVMNVTDVGHLTDDQDMGEDKIEKKSRQIGKSALEIASFYTNAFKQDLELLNIIKPDVWLKASETIDEQIDLIKQLEEKGFVYKISDGLYFDTSKFPEYNKLSHQSLEDLKEGARVCKNDEKRNSTDFALWKFSPSDSNRQMEWDSPWGIGFPGWHLECSAMSLMELKDSLDIHCGGMDHINVHHTNEIAQSEAATEKKFFNYWLHGAFLNISGGKKMAKSSENFLTIENALLKKGINPLAYRFAALQVHYRKPMEYSEESLIQAEKGLDSLRKQYLAIKSNAFLKGRVDKYFKEQFQSAINDDLNMPQALAILFSVFKSRLNPDDKLETAKDFDKVLGLSLDFEESFNNNEVEIPAEIKSLAEKRQIARDEKDFSKSDSLRDEIEKEGYEIEDGPDGYKLKKK
ncbi:MAG: cysteine--tRNA ligase [Patescibacteria group bacterium]|jgi:cysteinyl-tRNA synthetase|nr:cysteine--tRNA ligase [Patescibacteria group bacterium]